MPKPPNPITQGLRAVTRDPAIFLVEIIWRWSFALLACLLVVGVGLMLLGPLHLGNHWDTAWRSRDPQRMGQVVLGVVLLLGVKVIMTAAIAVPLAIVLLWGVLSALGRFVTVRRLRVDLTSLRFRSILALQFLRGFVGWFSFVLLFAATFGEALIASRGPKPDLLLYYLMMMPSVILISAFWLTLNWYLSLAAIFGREGQSFRGAFRQARHTVRLQRSDFAGTGFVFILFRTVALLIATAICGLTSGMAGSSPQGYSVLLMIVSLAYFAVADFLYMARMAAYLALAAAHVDPAGPKLVATSSTLPVENPTPL
ncbi:MAG TPA: hypothetical protein VNZ47_15670 [Candidatus Dormibacteraeota bacterium]|jgi:hypothetical protein|nr:hypothetical protein [Candidatus Dormibacteraeota bacterium]